jgi:hypothetical protein
VSLEVSVIIFDYYFDVCATDLSCLVSLPTENGGLYYVVADTFFTLVDGTQIVYFYGEQSIVSTESSTADVSDDQIFYDTSAVVLSTLRSLATIEDRALIFTIFSPESI